MRMQLREMLSPRVKFNSPYKLFEENYELNGDRSQLRIRHLVDWEIVLAANYVHSAIETFIEEKEWEKFLPFFLDDVTALLLEAMDIMRELQGADDKSDHSYWKQPSINEHSQNQKFYDWTALVEIARDSWRETARCSPERAIRQMHHWFELPYPIFKRLAFFALAERRDLFSLNIVLDRLLADEAWWLWSTETQREVMRLLHAIAPELKGKVSSELEQAILLGPPSGMFDYISDLESIRRIVDREKWLRLTILREQGTQLRRSTIDELQSLADAYPEWTPADEQDEFPIWTGNNSLGRTFAPTPASSKELVQWLKQHPDGDDFRKDDDWRDRCRKDFRRTASALLHLARCGNWITSRWRQALQAWAEEDLADRSWRCINQAIVSAPNEVISELSHALAWWLKAVAKSSKHSQQNLLVLVQRIFDVCQNDQVEESEDALTSAINHPVGMAIEAVLEAWYCEGLEDNQGLSGEIRTIFTRVSDAGISSFRHGRILLAAHAITLFRVDRIWVGDNLLSHFDWKRDQTEARSAWNGFLWSPRLYQPLLETVKRQFLETAEHYEQLGDTAQRQYAAFLTFVSLEEKLIFSIAQLRAATSALPPNGLMQSARVIVDGLNAAQERRAEYWYNRAKPYFRNIWPKSRELRTASISQQIAHIVIASEMAFPDALNVLRGWILPPQHPDLTLRLLNEAGHCASFPQEALEFVNLIVSEERLWVAKELRLSLIQLRSASATIVDDGKFQRLETLLRQTGSSLDETVHPN
ncbi:hypothetical protein ACNSPG_11540 [Brucella pituitosa]|uniref:hypothetical protein n=1 Tax=Brucella pituitosa TaxID=571256 RepID=UPI003C789059